jgi:sortase A
VTDIDIREANQTAELPAMRGRTAAPKGSTPAADGQPTKAREPLDARRLATQLLFTFSAVCLGFLVFVGPLSKFPQKRAQNGLERALAAKLHKGRAYVGGPIPSGSPIARMDIPRLALHQIVVEGTSADQLRKGPGHLPVSPFPGQPGNAVFAGHRWAWGAPFAGIDGLRRGDSIIVLTGQGRFTYQVEGHRLTSNNDVTPFQATSDNRLTLVTAADLSASQRWVVTASLTGDPQAAPPGKPTVLSSHEGGLVGQRGLLPILALWFWALVLVAVGTVFLYRVLPRWSSYVITTPIVLAVVWIVYANLARLLPATL